MSGGIRGVRCEGPADQIKCRFVLIREMGNHAQQVEGHRVMWLRSQKLQQQAFRLC